MRSIFLSPFLVALWPLEQVRGAAERIITYKLACNTTTAAGERSGGNAARAFGASILTLLDSEPQVPPPSSSSSSNRSLFAGNPRSGDNVETVSEEQYARMADFDLTRYVDVRVPPHADIDALLAAIKSDPLVEDAYIVPEIVEVESEYDDEDPGVGMRSGFRLRRGGYSGASTPDYSDCATQGATRCQGYLYGSDEIFAPFKLGGHNILKVHEQYPVKGKRARTWSYELAQYLATHEDLQPPFQSDTAQDPPGRHCTGSVGIFGADDNGYGIVGVAAGTKIGFVKFAGAAGLRRIANWAKPGDVVQSGIQYRTQDTNILAPPEVVPAVADWIRYLTEVLGVHVVTLAGNGSSDIGSFNPPLDLSHDPGSILVGALDPQYNERCDFSNFGERVTVFSWGRRVATTVILDKDITSPTNLYTFTFDGTSAANPIIAGLVGLLQSIAFDQGFGPVPPKRMREYLVKASTDVRENTQSSWAQNEKYPMLVPDAAKAVQIMINDLTDNPITSTSTTTSTSTSTTTTTTTPTTTTPSFNLNQSSTDYKSLCDSIPPWSPEKIYSKYNEEVTRDGKKYRQNFYSKNLDPLTNSHPLWGQPWKGPFPC